MEHRNKSRLIKHVFICLLILSANLGIAGTSEAIGKDYFVSASNGKKGNQGTKEAPFHTLEEGASRLSPGDILYVRAGTYLRKNKWWDPPSGTSWSNPVTIKAYQNEKVIVKPLPSAKYPGNTVFEFTSGKQYIIMDSLVIDATNGRDGFRMSEHGHHIRISNSEIKNAPKMGIQCKGATDLEFINLKIHDNWLGTYLEEGESFDDKMSYGIYLNSSRVLVKDSEIYNNYGYGIHLYSGGNLTDDNIIINNKIHDNFWAGIIVTGNKSGKNNQLFNNVIWKNRRGIHVDYGARDTMVYHNTIYDNARNQILLGKHGYQTYMKNNILVGINASNYYVLDVDGRGVSKIENNLILVAEGKRDLRITASKATTSQNLVGSAFAHKFVNPEKFDFHLTASSSAIGAGQILDKVKTDKEGVPRTPTSGYDIGAFQYSSIDQPTSLRVISQRN